jgi:hypothetical protein
MHEADTNPERRCSELLNLMEGFAEMYHHATDERTRAFALDRWNAAFREFTALSKPKRRATAASPSSEP